MQQTHPLLAWSGGAFNLMNWCSFARLSQNSLQSLEQVTVSRHVKDEERRNHGKGGQEEELEEEEEEAPLSTWSVV